MHVVVAIMLLCFLKTSFIVAFEKNESNKMTKCQQVIECQSMGSSSSCFGTSLPYKSTSPVLIAENATLELVQQQLSFWKALERVPKCWGIVQPFICSVFMPKCEDDVLHLPSQEMCEIIKLPCRIVEQTHDWPSFLKCENYPSKCENPLNKVKFNTTGHCAAPLLATESEINWFPNVEGCGLQCDNPLYTQEERLFVHIFIGVLGSICLLCCVFAVFSFIVDWKSSNKYPAVIIFYINWCFVLVTLACLAQFLPGGRRNIVCRRDGTQKLAEPSAGDNLSCLMVFIVIFYFMTAAIIWYALLAYSWHIFFKALGSSREPINEKSAYFHLFSWSLPLVLTITILTLSVVDGDSLSGVCFLTVSKWPIRTGFVLLPTFVSLTVGGFFMSRGLYTLWQVYTHSPGAVSEKAHSKIRATIIRLSVVLVMSCCFVITALGCHIYEYKYRHVWQDSLQKFLVCDAHPNNTALCTIERRPNIIFVYMNHLSLFGAGILMSSWVWTRSTIRAWRRCMYRFRKKPTNEPLKMTCDKVVARAYAKNNMVGSTRRLSLSLHSTHDDPVGMNIEMYDMSQELSSNWIAGMPKLHNPRGAFVQELPPQAAIRHTSSQSDINERQNSIDSQLSRLAQRTRKRKKRKLRGRSQVSPWPVQTAFVANQRHGSDSTLGSHASAHIPNLLLDSRGSTRIPSTSQDHPVSSSHRRTGSDKLKQENGFLFNRRYDPNLLPQNPIFSISGNVPPRRRWSGSFSMNDVMTSTVAAGGNPHPTMDDIILAYHSGYSSGLNSRRSSFDGPKLMMMRLPGQLSDSEVERPPHLAQQSLNMPIFKREVGRSSKAESRVEHEKIVCHYTLHDSSSS